MTSSGRVSLERFDCITRLRLGEEAHESGGRTSSLAAMARCLHGLGILRQAGEERAVGHDAGVRPDGGQVEDLWPLPEPLP